MSFFEALHDDLDIPGYSQEVLESMVATASEITEQISQYGVLDDDEIEEIKDNKERKEMNIQKAEQQSVAETPIMPSAQPQNSEIVADEDEKSEIGKYVVCPKCGEKIWL